MIGRREFVGGLGAAAVWPVGARAQQDGRVRRLAVLMPTGEDDSESQARHLAFLQELQKAGWIEGRNLRMDVRWASGDRGRMRSYAAELVGFTPDVILTGSNIVTTLASQQTQTIPIVFAGASDPFETGLIANMARPGGNVTGFTQLEITMGGKWLELLKDAAPHVNRVAVLTSPDGRSQPGFTRVIETAAASFGVQTVSVAAANPDEIERGINAFAGAGNGGVIVLSTPVFTVYREQIIGLAARFRLPTIYPYRFFARDGGLMAYGPDLVDQFRRAAGYVDRIFRGAKPSDLPVQAPTKFELVVNLKTAKAMALTISEAFLLRADEVIE
jgi:putative tryptophan/tyrosine transport system substrate-binding protein